MPATADPRPPTTHAYASWTPGEQPGSAVLGIVGADRVPLIEGIERPVRIVVEVEYADRTMRLEVLNPATAPEIRVEPADEPADEPINFDDPKVPWRSPTCFDASLHVRALPVEDPAGNAVVLTVVQKVR